jgi:hypothetical protein
MGPAFDLTVARSGMFDGIDPRIRSMDEIDLCSTIIFACCCSKK